MIYPNLVSKRSVAVWKNESCIVVAVGNVYVETEKFKNWEIIKNVYFSISYNLLKTPFHFDVNEQKYVFRDFVLGTIWVKHAV